MGRNCRIRSMLLTCYFLTALAAGEGSNEPQPPGRRLAAPVLAPSWQANIEVHGGGYIYDDTKGKFYSDSTAQHYRMTVHTHTDVFYKGEVQNLDLLSRNVPVNYFLYTYGAGPAAQCHPSSPPGKTFDTAGGNPFWWLPFATFKETKKWGNEHCDEWVYWTSWAQASICIAHDGTPRYLAHSALASHMAYISSVLGGFVVFSDAVAGPLPEGAFDLTPQCGAFPPAACKSKGKTVLDVYRVQGQDEPYELLNRNTGDALGGAFFMCQTGGDAEDKFVVHYKVTVDTAWLPFSNCQYDATAHMNTCNGAPGKQVGRGTPESLGGDKGHAGQCDDNTEWGSWYSFPSEGRCLPFQDLGTNGCTWKEELQRVVELSCLGKDRGMEKMCEKEEGGMLKKSATILVAALASDDSGKGGCPSREATARRLFV